MTESELDQLLARYVDEGDEAALTAILAAHAGLVRATCRRILGDHTLADDAEQEVAIRFTRQAAEIDGRVSAWLHRCARNAAIDLLRTERARDRREAAWAEAQAATDATPPPSSELAAVDEALAELDADDHQLLLEHWIHGRSQRELAASAGVSHVAIGKRLRRIEAQLRRRLRRSGLLLFLLCLGSGRRLLSAERLRQLPGWWVTLGASAAALVIGGIWLALARGAAPVAETAAATAPGSPTALASAAVSPEPERAVEDRFLLRSQESLFSEHPVHVVVVPQQRDRASRIRSIPLTGEPVSIDPDGPVLVALHFGAGAHQYLQCLWRLQASGGGAARWFGEPAAARPWQTHVAGWAAGEQIEWAQLVEEAGPVFVERSSGTRLLRPQLIESGGAATTACPVDDGGTIEIEWPAQTMPAGRLVPLFIDSVAVQLRCFGSA